MGAIMNNFIDKIDNLLSVKNSTLNLLPIQLDTYRRLFSMFINYESISKVILTIRPRDFIHVFL